MSLFNFLKPKTNKGQFVNESDFKVNLKNQLLMSPQTLVQLRKHDVTTEKELKIEFFFYTNTSDKAILLAKELEKLNYIVQNRVSAGDKRLFIVTGWTTKIKMSEEVVKKWTNQMCEIGYKFDCEFDGWGTNPYQE